jgi:hypothetical protein
MFTLPIIAFYAAKQYFGTDNYAAAAAILTTNCVVGAYCYAAYTEKDETKEEQPRVGRFKDRVD